jgi:hypothetical protein
MEPMKSVLIKHNLDGDNFTWGVVGTFQKQPRIYVWALLYIDSIEELLGKEIKEAAKALPLGGTLEIEVKATVA